MRGWVLAVGLVVAGPVWGQGRIIGGGLAMPPCTSLSECLSMGFRLATTTSQFLEARNGDRRVLVTHYLTRGADLLSCKQVWYPDEKPRAPNDLDVFTGCSLAGWP